MSKVSSLINSAATASLTLTSTVSILGTLFYLGCLQVLIWPTLSKPFWKTVKPVKLPSAAWSTLWWTMRFFSWWFSTLTVTLVLKRKREKRPQLLFSSTLLLLYNWKENKIEENSVFLPFSTFIMTSLNMFSDFNGFLLSKEKYP
jgi:hypothetical protein